MTDIGEAGKRLDELGDIFASLMDETEDIGAFAEISALWFSVKEVTYYNMTVGGFFGALRAAAGAPEELRRRLRECCFIHLMIWHSELSALAEHIAETSYPDERLESAAAELRGIYLFYRDHCAELASEYGFLLP